MNPGSWHSALGSETENPKKRIAGKFFIFCAVTFLLAGSMLILKAGNSFAETRVFYNEIDAASCTTINEANDNPDGSCHLADGGVDTTKAFIIYTNTANDTTPSLLRFTAKFVDAHSLEFQRNSNDTDASQIIRYYVIESDAFEVYWAEHDMAADDWSDTEVLTSLIDIKPNKSFIVYGVRSASISANNYAGTVLVGANLEYTESVPPAAADQIQFYRKDVSGKTEEAITISYFVVTVKDDSWVQQGKAAAAANDYMVSDDLATAVDRSKAFLIFNFCNTDYSVDQRWRGAITSDLQVGFNKRAKGGTTDIYYYCVELGTLGFSEGGEGLQKDTVDAVANWDFPLAKDFGNTARRFSLISQDCVGTGSQNDRISSAVGFLDVDGAEKLRVTRRDNTQASVTDYFAVYMEPMKLFTPNGGENWKCGTEYDITWYCPWDGSKGIAKVDVLLSEDAGATWPVTIASDVDNDPDNGVTTLPWTIPSNTLGLIGANRKVGIVIAGGTINADSALHYNCDISDSGFTIIGDLQLTQPDTPGTKWIYDHEYNIKWKAHGHNTDMGNVRLRYSINSGSDYPADQIIATVTPHYNEVAGVSIYPWTVKEPAPGYPTVDCIVGSNLRMLVEQVSDPTNVFDEGEYDFRVDPEVKLLFPNATGVGDDKTIWEIGEPMYIEWEPHGLMGTNKVSVEITRNQGGNWSAVEAEAYNIAYNYNGGSGACTYPWSVEGPATSGADAKIRVKSEDYSGIAGESLNYFKIQETIHVDIPSLTEIVWRAGAQNTIQWTVRGLTSANFVKIYYSLDGGTNYTFLIQRPAQAGNDPEASSTYGWTPDSSHLTSKAKIKVTRADQENIADESDNIFQIKGNVSVTKPTLNEVIPIGKQYTITWDVTAGVTGTANIYLYKPSVGYEPIGTAPIDQKYAYWTPTQAQMGGGRKIMVAKQGDEDLAKGTAGESATFDVKADLDLTYPDTQSGLAFDAGGKLYIKWTPNPENFGDVKVNYNKDGGSFTGIGQVASNFKPNGTDIGFEWNDIPEEAVSNVVRIRIEQVGEDTKVYAVSQQSFKIRGSITITRPVGGEKWQAGKTENISWTKKGNLGNVKINYSLSTGSAEYTGDIIGERDSANSPYPWPISTYIFDDIETELRATVRIKIQSLLYPDIAKESNAFTIKSRFYGLSSNVDSGQKLYVGDPCNITWITDGYKKLVDVLYSTDGGSPNIPLVSSTPNINGFDLETVGGVPDAPGNQVKFMVRSTLQPNEIYVMSSGNNIIDKKTLTITYPGGVTEPNLVLYAGDPYLIKWTYYGSILTVKLDYSINNGSDYNYPIASDVNVAGGTGGYSWPGGVPNQIKGKVIKVRVQDMDNDTVNGESVYAFSIAGKINLTKPDGGETWYVGTKGDIKWTPTGSYDSVKIVYTVDGGSWKDIAIVPAGTNGVPQTYSDFVPVPVDITTTFKVKIFDP
ncbi:MAG: hypothetical protein COS99_02145, partial [Candidatus Omnitrophica bacterium CG07_land_8_20_14_0_80_42_15]